MLTRPTLSHVSPNTIARSLSPNTLALASVNTESDNFALAIGPSSSGVWSASTLPLFTAFGPSSISRPVVQSASLVVLIRTSLWIRDVLHSGERLGRTSSSNKMDELLRAGADEKPLRMVKTILHELVKLCGISIKGHLSLVPIDMEPGPIILAYIDLNLQTPILCKDVLATWCQQTILNALVTIYSYNGTTSCFFSNANQTTDTTISFQDNQFTIPAGSVSILPDCKTETYNIAKADYAFGSSEFWKNNIAFGTCRTAKTWIAGKITFNGQIQRTSAYARTRIASTVKAIVDERIGNGDVSNKQGDFLQILLSANTLSDNEKLSFVDWFREMCGHRFVVLLIGCRTLRIS
ncbi:hypothetical protein Syun_004381 [Stephania yunnanensis]|uniref:Beta-galactosidase beta-sandwich domain-containing protein n=1 Tax=Stephania yunnanensis TaxID=152371 RepID=A0AAP0Q2H1_9MAGN